jgi:putative acetyltransferase
VSAEPGDQVSIRRETDGDVAAIHAVNRLAFGQEDEARLVDELRNGGYVRLSLVAEVAGQIVGHILFSELPIATGDGRTIDALSLAPMAVTPEFQRRGIGSSLLKAALAQCRADGHCIVVVLGHPEYYPRFGFSSEQASQLSCPLPVPPEAWMAIELNPGALRNVAGRVVYAPPFGL